MRRTAWRGSVAAALLTAVVMAGAPAVAETSLQDEMTEKQRRAAELAREATEKLMQALEFLMDSLPQYGLPRIDKDGNIIIPRIPRDKSLPDPERSTPDDDAPIDTAI